MKEKIGEMYDLNEILLKSVEAEETVLYAQDPAGMNKRINFM
ncbi:MAG: hypothetical protein U0M37_10500 [Blautia sp.]